VAACTSPAPVNPLTRETLQALLDFERPRFEQCLVDADSLLKTDASADVEVVVAATARASVSARNLTPEGVACLEKVPAKLKLPPSSSPLVARLVVNPPAGAPEPNPEFLPEVTLLRKEVVAACACFELLGANAPPQLLLVQKPGKPVDILTTSDPLADKIERCLEERLSAHTPPAFEVTVDLPLLNGDAQQDSPDASPDVVEAQRRAMATRHRANAKLLEARRAALEKQLEPVVLGLKRKSTPALIKQRAKLCQLMFDIEDELVASVQRATEALVRAGEQGALSELSKSVTTEPSERCAALKPPPDSADE
jgi:hypothetical protein